MFHGVYLIYASNKLLMRQHFLYVNQHMLLEGIDWTATYSAINNNIYIFSLGYRG